MPAGVAAWGSAMRDRWLGRAALLAQTPAGSGTQVTARRGEEIHTKREYLGLHVYVSLISGNSNPVDLLTKTVSKQLVVLSRLHANTYQGGSCRAGGAAHACKTARELAQHVSLVRS